MNTVKYYVNDLTGECFDSELDCRTAEALEAQRLANEIKDDWRLLDNLCRHTWCSECPFNGTGANGEGCVLHFFDENYIKRNVRGQ